MVQQQQHQHFEAENTDSVHVSSLYPRDTVVNWDSVEQLELVEHAHVLLVDGEPPPYSPSTEDPPPYMRRQPKFELRADGYAMRTLRNVAIVFASMDVILCFVLVILSGNKLTSSTTANMSPLLIPLAYTVVSSCGMSGYIKEKRGLVGMYAAESKSIAEYVKFNGHNRRYTSVH
eukprot:jgi/Hompol1/1414/HPOL_005589-RA